MSLIRIAATAGAGLFLGLAPVSAAPINPAGAQTIGSRVPVEQIYYRHYNNNPTPPSSRFTIEMTRLFPRRSLAASCPA